MKVGTRHLAALLLGLRVFTRGRELWVTNRVMIEEHQAEELGVQQLHYLYKLLKATSAW